MLFIILNFANLIILHLKTYMYQILFYFILFYIILYFNYLFINILLKSVSIIYYILVFIFKSIRSINFFM